MFGDNYKLHQSNNVFALNSEWRTLYEYLKPLGKSGDKYISRELLNYTKYLPDLLDALYKGDGDNPSTQKQYQKEYLRLNTKSKALADTTQEAWLRLGKLATINHRDREAGRIYTVEVKTLTYVNFLFNKYKQNKNKQFEERQYKGKIYCVIVPNGNFITRHRKTKLPIVTGNSADMCLFDETQSLKEDIIPVVQETMARSMYKRTMYAGTPMRSKGTLADKWFRSTQNEFLLKCNACGH